MASPAIQEPQQGTATRETERIVSVGSGGGAPPSPPSSPPGFGGGAGASRGGGSSERLNAREVFIVLTLLREEGADSDTACSARDKIQRASRDAETGLTLLP